MIVTFIRHGQSTANAGASCNDIAKVELTQQGWQQARNAAANWVDKPSLIVISPFLRTQQAAAPTMERFPVVPVEIWPIQEFTYLQPKRWSGTLGPERLPYIERYWDEANPAYCDGEGAESFSMLLRRAEATLNRLIILPQDALVYVFAHGQYMQAVKSVALHINLSDQERMRNFWRKDEPPVIPNAALLCLGSIGESWSLEPSPPLDS